MAPHRAWPGPRLPQPRHKSLWRGRGRMNSSKGSSPAAGFGHLGVVWGGRVNLRGPEAHFTKWLPWAEAFSHEPLGHLPGQPCPWGAVTSPCNQPCLTAAFCCAPLLLHPQPGAHNSLPTTTAAVHRASHWSPPTPTQHWPVASGALGRKISALQLAESVQDQGTSVCPDILPLAPGSS